MNEEKNFTVLLLTHGETGNAMIEASRMILGNSDYLFSIPLKLGVSLGDYVMEVEEYVKKLTTPAVIITDIYGGTPSNVALMLSNKYDLKVISGLNLGLLLEIMCQRGVANVDLDTILKNSLESSKSLIKIIEVEE